MPNRCPAQSPAQPPRDAGSIWVELVGEVLVARIRGVPNDALVRDCQTRIVAILQDTNCKRIMYDALELDNPTADVARAQQTLTSALLDPQIRIAIVVPNTKVAYFSRLAFGDANHRVFYNDMSAALAWLESSQQDASVSPFSSDHRAG